MRDQWRFHLSKVYKNHIVVANEAIASHYFYFRNSVAAKVYEDPLKPLRIYQPCKDFVLEGIEEMKEDFKNFRKNNNH